MISVNCTPHQFVEHLIGELKAGCGLAFGDYARRWMRSGASAVGGCCRTVDSHIREVVKARELFRKLG